jgi:hypothetical protein
MTRSRAVAALGFVLLAPLLSTPQSSPSVPSTVSTEQSFVPPLYLDKPSDSTKWLKDHESFLQRGDVCGLNMSFVKPEFRSGLVGVAMFMVAPGDPDNFEEYSTVIHDPEPGLDVRVGARYTFSDGKVAELEIALAFEGAPDNVFNEITSTQASSIRDKNWKSLKLIRRKQIGDTLYDYYLSCSNGKTAASYLHKPIKHRRRFSY